MPDTHTWVTLRRGGMESAWFGVTAPDVRHHRYGRCGNVVHAPVWSPRLVFVPPCTDRSGDGSISLTEFLGFCRKDKKSFGCVCVGCHAGVALASNL